MTEHYATLKKDGLTFEISVDPDLAIEFRKGKDHDIREILKSGEIFSDIRKGNLAKDSDIQKVFKTDDSYEAAKKIIHDGDIQLSAEYRKKLRDMKVKEIIHLIHRNAIDPSTGHPHPESRIANAIEESKAKIDYNKSANEQIDVIMKEIRSIIPIKFEKKIIEIKIPSSIAGKLYGKVINFGRKLNESWNNDGSLTVKLEIPAGIELELYENLNNLSNGQAETKVVER